MTDEITPDSLLQRVARAPALPPGHPAGLPPRFEVRGILGEGGFGVVYDVYDREREEPVALKMLRHASPEAVLRFKREFRTLADIRHDNLVRLHELGGAGADLWFTMERVDGRRFDRWVGRDHDRLRRATVQLARGLTALHGAGVLHRDLKASNVLVEAGGRVVLLDFGLARDLRSNLSTQLAGTPLTMAPEQCAQAPIGPPADWYALGAMLFAALTGEYPFEGAAMRIMMDKQRLDPRPVRTVAGVHAPDDLADLTDALLARRPEARPCGADVLRILGEAPVGSPPEVSPGAFVGRTLELEELRAALWESRRGARLVRVEGPSGIGKTTLVRAFLREVAHHHPDAWVLSGRCHPRESVPYKALDSVVDQLAGHLRSLPSGRSASLLPRDAGTLAAVFPALGALAPQTAPAPPMGDGPVDLRRRALSALRELLGRVSERREIVVWIDDLQWGDQDSASLLAELLRDPESPRVLFVTTSRSAGAGPLAQRFEQLVHAGLSLHQRTVQLAELTESEALELATELVGSAGHRARTIATQSRGHPLFLSELAQYRHLGSLDELFESRLDACSHRERTVLTSLAVAGAPLHESLVAHVIETEARATVDALIATRLVQRGGASETDLTLFHDRLRGLVLQRASRSVQRELHGTIAAALERRGDDAERIAEHWREAGEDARAADHAERAAHHARSTLAHRRAADLYTLTLELRRRAGLQSSRQLQIARAEALAGSGHVRDAAEALLKAASTAPSAEARELRARAVSHLLAGGHLQHGMAVLRNVLGELGMRLPGSTPEATARIAAASTRRWLRQRISRPSSPTPESRARLDALWGAYGGLTPVAPLYGLAAGAMHAAEAERVDDPLHRFRARTLPAFSDVFRRGPAARDRARARLHDAYADAARAPTPAIELHRAYGEALVEHFGLRLRESLPLLDATVALGQRQGQLWSPEVTTARALRSSLVFVLGDIPRGRREIPELVQEAEERGHLLAWVLYALHQTYLWNFGQQADAQVDALLQRVRQRWSSSDVEMQDWWLDIARLHILLARGDPRRAHEVISHGWLAGVKHRVILSRYHFLEGQAFRARASIALAAHDPGHAPRLLREARAAAAALRAEPCPWTLCLALALDAGIASVRGRPGDALRHLRALIPACDEAGMSLLGALARDRAGMLMGGDAGAALRSQAASFYAEATIDDPARAVRFTLPGAW